MTFSALKLLGERIGALRKVEVDIAEVVGYLGFGYGKTGWHPLKAAALEILERSGDVPPFEQSNLAQFYARFQPASVAEAYGLDAGHAPASAAVSARDLIHFYPWSKQGKRLGAGQCQHYGPAETVGPSHYSRMVGLVRSIADTGFKRTSFPGNALRGMWLVEGGQRRFILRGGQHRVAALAALGVEHIDARCMGTVNVADVEKWARVTSGQMLSSEALALARQYFLLDGTERAPDRLAGSAPGP